MEIVDEKDLKRFAVITFEDWKEYMRGVYDYEKSMYLDYFDLIDLVGCQLHSEG